MACERHSGGLRFAEAPSHVSAADERSGCSSAEPYPLACWYGLSVRDCSRQAWAVFRRSSMARYSLTKGSPQSMA
jgi:hypothetical protein